MKTKYGHNQRGYKKSQNLKIWPPKRLQYLTRKHPITQKHPTIHKDNLKHLNIIADGDEQKTQVPGEEPSMEKRGKERKISGNSIKKGENKNSTED